MKDKDSIVFIGMPGVGKSTVGVILAKILGYRFVDTDIVIQHREGRRLCELIEEYGVDGFIEIENRINCQIDEKRTVIATGGSAVYGREAMEHYKETSVIIYLKLRYEDIETRLGDIKNRGVVLKEGQNLRDIYDERCELYEKYADIIIDETGLNVEDTIDKIIGYGLPHID